MSVAGDADLAFHGVGTGFDDGFGVPSDLFGGIGTGSEGYLVGVISRVTSFEFSFHSKDHS